MGGVGSLIVAVVVGVGGVGGVVGGVGGAGYSVLKVGCLGMASISIRCPWLCTILMPIAPLGLRWCSMCTMLFGDLMCLLLTSATMLFAVSGVKCLPPRLSISMLSLDLKNPLSLGPTVVNCMLWVLLRNTTMCCFVTLCVWLVCLSVCLISMLMLAFRRSLTLLSCLCSTVGTLLLLDYVNLSRCRVAVMTLRCPLLWSTVRCMVLLLPGCLMSLCVAVTAGPLGSVPSVVLRLPLPTVMTWLFVCRFVPLVLLLGAIVCMQMLLVLLLNMMLTTVWLFAAMIWIL